METASLGYAKKAIVSSTGQSFLSIFMTPKISFSELKICFTAFFKPWKRNDQRLIFANLMFYNIFSRGKGIDSYHKTKYICDKI